MTLHEKIPFFSPEQLSCIAESWRMEGELQEDHEEAWSSRRSISVWYRLTNLPLREATYVLGYSQAYIWQIIEIYG